MGTAAKSTLHEYATDSFADYTDSATAEGSGASVVDLTAPTRSNNVNQIFKDDVNVSNTEIAVNGVVEPFKYQLGKVMVQQAKNIELAFMAGSRNSGNSGVARRLQGVINAITTNATTRASGTSLGEVALNDILQMIWTGTGKVATNIYVGATLKRDITSLSTTVTRFQDAASKRLTKPVSVYESDFGVHEIYLHRNVPTGANNLTLVAINPEFHRKSYLRPTQTVQLPPDGDRTRAMIVTEVTLEHKGEKTGAVVGGFTS